MKLKAIHEEITGTAYEDVVYLKELLTRAGYEADEEEIVVAWARYSEAHAAGWMMPNTTDSHNLAALLAYMEPVDD